MIFQNSGKLFGVIPFLFAFLNNTVLAEAKTQDKIDSGAVDKKEIVSISMILKSISEMVNEDKDIAFYITKILADFGNKINLLDMKFLKQLLAESIKGTKNIEVVYSYDFCRQLVSEAVLLHFYSKNKALDLSTDEARKQALEAMMMDPAMQANMFGLQKFSNPQLNKSKSFVQEFINSFNENRNKDLPNHSGIKLVNPMDEVADKKYISFDSYYVQVNPVSIALTLLCLHHCLKAFVSASKDSSILSEEDTYKALVTFSKEIMSVNSKTGMPG